MTGPYHTELGDSLAARAGSLFGSAPALVGEGFSISFDEMATRVGLIAGRLEASGIGAGDLVAIRCADVVDNILLLLASIAAGCTAAPVPAHYPVDSLVRMFAGIGARYLIEDAGVPSLARPDLGFAPISILSDSVLAPGTPAGEQQGAAAAGGQLDPQRLAVAIFTSGSTGTPQAAALRYSNLIYSALGSCRNIELDCGDRWLMCLPLYHIAGISILVRCFLSGAAIVVSKITGVDEARLVDRFSVTHVSVVPTQLRRLLDGHVKGRSLKVVLCGGGHTSTQLAERARRDGIPLRLTYGLTEMASQVATSGADENDVRSSGRVLPFRSVRLGSNGEILVRGETLFAGYLEKSGLRSAVDRDGWFHTGDRGHFDNHNNLRIDGRLDGLIISGGENIQPEEIEQVVDNIVGIARSVVVGVQNEEFGERPVVFVSYLDRPIPEADILERVRAVLPRYKLPVAVFEMPDTADFVLDKIDRGQLSGIAHKLMCERDLSPP